ncbi:DNA polymerase IV [Tessaracoccus sp. MC1865]|uniref:DNA polymerase IV n=1 Tax=Tessaracoccus sp. MC1865 TaxID=2760310 RepID=UPI001600E992|nr:DNA polymerase IV [Tessaracoccus sp. MC1865]MBB1483610.1 DNA polymerase IV [Tessaracoccus sp. MC1865]QTO36689.1 DNA polymerase IV [Tessaracoccus sp. MC1865]
MPTARSQASTGGLPQVVVHVDMDAFYASVEMARHPELRDVPMFVGGSTRGVVLSANYPARRYGITAGMPSSRARRLCPQVAVVHPDHDHYGAVSTGIGEIFDTFTDKVEMASIDEAFMDLTTAMRRLGEDPVAVGEQLRAQVMDEQGVACSVGIGPNKFIAKLASKQAKPDGLRLVQAQDVIAFLHPLPVDAIWGVGEVTAGKLRKLGLETVRDLANTPRATLQRAMGDNLGAMLFDLSWGRDERSVLARQPAEHSVGSQETFARDTDDAAIVATEILRMAERTAARMRAQEMVSRTVTLSVRFADFTTITRTGTLKAFTDRTNDVYAEAMRLYGKLNLQRARIRRVGVRMEKLVPKATTYEQPALDEPAHGWSEAEQAVDRAVLRFGPKAVQRARLTRRPALHAS